MWFYLINTSAYVVSRKSRSAVKKNRIMKLYFFKRYDWPVVWSRDLDHVKAKQENAFPHSEGMHTRWRDCPCFACLYILIFMVFWHQSTLCKVISQVADTVNSDLPAFCLVQATLLWRILYHRMAKSFSRTPRNEGAKVRSVTFWRSYRDLLQKGRIKQMLLLNDIVTSTWRIAADLIYAYRELDIWWKRGLKLHFITLSERRLIEMVLR